MKHLYYKEDILFLGYKDRNLANLLCGSLSQPSDTLNNHQTSNACGETIAATVACTASEVTARHYSPEKHAKQLRRLTRSKSY